MHPPTPCRVGHLDEAFAEHIIVYEHTMSRLSKIAKVIASLAAVTISYPVFLGTESSALFLTPRRTNPSGLFGVASLAIALVFASIGVGILMYRMAVHGHSEAVGRLVVVGRLLQAGGRHHGRGGRMLRPEQPEEALHEVRRLDEAEREKGAARLTDFLDLTPSGLGSSEDRYASEPPCGERYPSRETMFCNELHE